MSRYLLDTNAIIALLGAATRAKAAISRRVRAHNPRDILLSSLVMHELFFGAFKSGRVAPNVALVDGIALEVLAFDKEDARASGEIRALLAKNGRPIGPYDVLIAGQARARDLILVTHNVREFSRVPDLLIEDWEKRP